MLTQHHQYKPILNNLARSSTHYINAVTAENWLTKQVPSIASELTMPATENHPHFLKYNRWRTDSQSYCKTNHLHSEWETRCPAIVIGRCSRNNLANAQGNSNCHLNQQNVIKPSSLRPAQKHSFLKCMNTCSQQADPSVDTHYQKGLSFIRKQKSFVETTNLAKEQKHALISTLSVHTTLGVESACNKFWTLTTMQKATQSKRMNLSRKISKQ